MKLSTTFFDRMCSCRVPVLAATLVACLAGCAVTQAGPVDLTIGADKYPGADAIILRWEQTWTLDKDGKAHRRDHQWVKLMNTRPIGRYADPRIDFVDGKDEVIIHTARTHVPGGEILPVPDYSFNIAAPDDVAGWPEYAGWQQQIVCFSGVQAGAVVELDYEVISPADAMPWIEADLRLNEIYPTVARVVTVTVPRDVALTHHALRDQPIAPTTDTAADGAVSYRWEFTDLKGDPNEPQAPPWSERSARLRFTTCADAASWASALLARVNAAGRPNDDIREFAKSVVEQEPDPTERIAKLSKKIRDTFNFIDSPKAMRGLRCRGAGEVYRANYGNPLEAAALLLASARAMDLAPTVMVAINAERWAKGDAVAPSAAAFDGVALKFDIPGANEQTLYVDAHHGEFTSPGNWGRHWLLWANSLGVSQATYIHARGEIEPSELALTGKITVSKDGKASGDLRVNATGAFFEPSALETADAQKKLAKDLASRVLSDFELTGHSVTTLSQDSLRMVASVESKDSESPMDGLRTLRLGDGPAFLPEFPMPLNRSYRRTDVRLNGAFNEQVDITVEFPEGWALTIIPASAPPASGQWGSIAQTVDVNGTKVHLRRSVNLTTATLTAAEFDVVRRAVNDLRSSQATMLAGKKPAKTN